MSDDSIPGSSSGVIFRKLEDMMQMHMRTREDIADIKGSVQRVADAQVRIEARQGELEHDVDRRLNELAATIEARHNQTANEVRIIREERIAEKAQWRGPEKIIALLGAVAVVIGLIASIAGFFK